MQCLECHHLGMILFHFFRFGEVGIASTIVEFLRPALVFSVVSDFDGYTTSNSVTCMDSKRKTFLYEAPMPNDFYVIDAIRIHKRASLACVLMKVDSLGLFDMQTGEWQLVLEMEHPCLAGRIAHVPRDGLIVFGNGRSLRMFDDETLWASGLMDFRI